MKSHTNIPQSKKLAEILPLESADMSFVEKGNAKCTWYDAENKRITTAYEKKYYVPCWSLAALLAQMPCVELVSSQDNHYRTFWHDMYSEWHESAVDACVELLLRARKEEEQ